MTVDDGWDHPTMTRAQFEARLEELSIENALAEAEQAANGAETPFWWLSFCDANLPKGTQFLGAAMVQAGTSIGAVDRAHKLKINPGGEVAMAGPIPAETMSEAFRDKWCERLLDKAEACRMAAGWPTSVAGDDPQGGDDAVDGEVTVEDVAEAFGAEVVDAQLIQDAEVVNEPPEGWL